MREVERAHRRRDPLGETADALPQPVVLGQGVAFLRQRVALAIEAATPAVELLGPALELDQLDHPGLVEIDQPPPLGLGGLGPALEAGELGAEQFVVGAGARAVTALSPASSTSGRSSASRT